MARLPSACSALWLGTGFRNTPSQTSNRGGCAGMLMPRRVVQLPEAQACNGVESLCQSDIRPRAVKPKWHYCDRI